MEDKIYKKLLEHDKRFDAQDKKFERIISHSLKQDDKFADFDKKIRELDGRITMRMDEMLVIAQRIDMERVFTFELYKRLEKDMEKVKKILKIA